MLTFDVLIYKIRDLRRGRKPFQLRWRVGDAPHSKTFKTKTLADGRRSELMSFLREGQRFDTNSGLPESEIKAAKQQITWYAHAVEFAEKRWKQGAAKTRAGRAEGLATVTPALVVDTKGAPPAAVLRRALSCWAFNFSEHRMEPPPSIAAALEWIAQKSLPISALEDDPDTVLAALDAIALKLNGDKAAANTITRKRTAFNGALEYAVRRKRLPSNPLKFADWTPPGNDDEIDFQFVPNPQQAAALIEGAAKQGQRGRHLTAFFGCMYYAAMRPGEVTRLRRKDCTLPDEGWGELLLAGSSPRIGSRWTDTGESFDERGLKRRAPKATRPVPIPPELVKLLREHIAAFGVGKDGLLFRAAEGGHLLSKEYSEVWKLARAKALTDEQVGSPFAGVPYSLRKAGVSFWILSGVDPAEVARRAGHSIAVLYRFYARVLDGQREQANEKIENALRKTRNS
jgi:integrase